MKAAWPFSKKVLLPEVEEVDGDAVFLTEIGDRDFVERVFSEQGDLLLGGEMATLLGHGCSSARVLPLTLSKASSCFDWGNTDTKIVSKVLELLLFPMFVDFAKQHSLGLELCPQQNFYPDLTFVDKQSADKIRRRYQKHLSNRQQASQWDDLGGIHRIFPQPRKLEKHTIPLKTNTRAISFSASSTRKPRKHWMSEALHARRPRKDNLRHQELPVLCPAEVPNCSRWCWKWK